MRPIKIYFFYPAFLLVALSPKTFAQTNLLLNGDFEDINVCTEYSAKCGVEAWFYLNEVKVRMLNHENNPDLPGDNSIGIYYNWPGYPGFTPVIGTLLPCRLQKNNRYTFTGIFSARLNSKLTLKPGVCLGEKFYVQRRDFSRNMKPDTIIQVRPAAGPGFYEFDYSFVADGREKYLTFGCFIEEDTLLAKGKRLGPQAVNLVLDHFQLIPENNRETVCPDFLLNKETIYSYNFRHKEMDYALFGKGELNISFPRGDSNGITRITDPAPLIARSDTLKIGDVFFDFNKAGLKPAALEMLDSFFISHRSGTAIDSIYVEGHTDSIGSDNSNLVLSQQRCESVREWLLQNNITPVSRIAVHPYGKSKPVASNSTSRGRALNRRVEMIVFRKPEK